MVSIVVHIVFGIILLLSMKSEPKAPEQPKDNVTIEQQVEK